MRLATAAGEITDLDSWFRFAPPKGKEKQWVDGYSAKELARAWCRNGTPAPPEELTTLFSAHPSFHDLYFENGEPEARIRFDTLRGEPRNADLSLVGRDADGVVAISVEAKGHESFGDYLGDALTAALEAKLTNDRSGALLRIQQLVSALLPARETSGLPALATMRYQLLTGVAGALAWGRELGATRAVFLVHEFHTEKSDSDKQAVNARDLAVFVQRLSGSADHERVEGIVGPFAVKGAPLFEDPPSLYIGKLTTHVAPGVV